MYTVFVEGLEFFGLHGVSPEEHKVWHRFTADLRLEVEGTADSNDQIKHTVDYVTAAKLVLELSARKPFLTLERMADAIASELLKRHPLIETAWVRLGKPLPSADIIAETVGVELEKSR